MRKICENCKFNTEKDLFCSNCKRRLGDYFCPKEKTVEEEMAKFKQIETLFNGIVIGAVIVSTAILFASAF